MTNDELVRLSFDDAEALWLQWALDADDVLARAAFERTLRHAVGIEEDGLYFRPGGWVVNVPATVARLACAAAVLAAGFQVVGLEDLPREIVIAAAGLVSSMDVRPVRLGRRDLALGDHMREQSLEDAPVSPPEALNALPQRLRTNVTEHEIADALDRLVAAGLADRVGADEYVLRARNNEAWIRISLRPPPGLST